MTATLEVERQRCDIKLAEAQQLKSEIASADHQMTHAARIHVARLRAYIAQGRVRALEAGAHPNKLCGEPVYSSSGK